MGFPNSLEHICEHGKSAASGEEQLAAIKEITATCDQLASMSERLSSLVKRFEV